jgi:NAD+ synthase
VTGTPRSRPPIAPDVLRIDAPRVTEEIVASLRAIVRRSLRRHGGVVAVSGGIDSAVTAALCARAFGAERTLALLMPEADSDPATPGLSRALVDALGVPSAVEDITAILEATRCYERRDEAVRSVVPEYGDGWRLKIVLPSVLAHEGYRLFGLVAQAPDGRRVEVRLPAAAYLAIVAATNFKQRTRKMLEYFHADRLNYAVIGTPNRLEYDQGFFVKLGDGAADVKPIAHLYKSQVYQLAAHLGVPKAIRSRPPMTDTYSLAQTQDEFYFSLPYAEMDLCLYARDHDLAAEQVAEAVGLTADGVERVFADIDRKRTAARYLHLGPQLVSPVPHAAPEPVLA